MSPVKRSTVNDRAIRTDEHNTMMNKMDSRQRVRLGLILQRFGRVHHDQEIDKFYRVKGVKLAAWRVASRFRIFIDSAGNLHKGFSIVTPADLDSRQLYDVIRSLDKKFGYRL